MGGVALCHNCDGVGRPREEVPMREEQQKEKKKEKRAPEEDEGR